MPPRGVKSSKRERQYEHIKASAKKRGRSTRRAKEIAAATVNKQRRQAGETKTGRKKSSASRRKTASSSRKGSAGRKSSSQRASSSRKSSGKKR